MHLLSKAWLQMVPTDTDIIKTTTTNLANLLNQMSVVYVIVKQKAAALGRGLQRRYSLFHTEVNGKTKL